LDQFKLLKAARSRAKASITRLLTASQDPRAGSKWELDEQQVSLERLNIVWKELESIRDVNLAIHWRLQGVASL